MKNLILAFLLLCSLSSYSQTAGTAVLMTLQNVVQTNSNTFEFELWLQNTGTLALSLRGYSAGVNTTTGYENGGVITSTYLNRDVSLSTIPVPTVNSTTANHIRITTSAATAGNEVLLAVGSPAVKLARIRISTSTNWLNNSNPFLPNAPNTALQLNQAAGRTNCIATCYVSSISYGLIGTVNSPSASNLNVLSGIVNPSPTGANPFLLQSCVNTFSAASVTQCDSYTWQGNTYTNSGTYIHTNTVGATCVNTDTLFLTINYSTSSSLTVTNCNSYTWLGNTYTTSGIYTNTSMNAGGCVFTQTLNLTVPSSSSTSNTVSACNSYLWAISGLTYTNSGTYTITSLNAGGCVHADQLVLTIIPNGGTNNIITACNTYTWPSNGVTYTASGVFNNPTGLCGIDTLTLTINNATSSSSSVNACDTYTWPVNNQSYTASGTYNFTSTNAANCLHTDMLILNIQNSTSSTTAATACNTYIWPVTGLSYSVAGTYTSTSLNAAGCLYTQILNLSVCAGSNPAAVFEFNNLSEVSSTQFEFDLWVTNTGNTTLNAKSLSFGLNCTPNIGVLNMNYINGSRDPIFNVLNTYASSASLKGTSPNTYYHLRMTSANATTGTEPLLAANIPYKVGRFVVTTSANWPSLQNPFLPPATISAIQLTTLAGYTQCILGALVNGGTTGYSLIGTTNTPTSTNLNVLTANMNPNPTGPSPFLLNLTCYHTSSSGSVNTCGSYTWSDNGVTYTSSGVYTSTTLIGSGPCINTATLNLTINNNTTTSETITACDQYTWTANAQTYTNSGVYMHTTLIGSGPCFHTATLNLTINQTSSSSFNQVACNSYLWSANGITYTNSGTYSTTSLNSSGCLHTTILNLTINYTSSSSVSITDCNNYQWAVNGQTYTASGTYTSTSVNANGCVHTDQLILTIIPNGGVNNIVISCDSYFWPSNGTTYTSSGIYNNPTGLCGIDTLTLTINNNTSSTSSFTSCNMYSWPVNGVTYTQSGAYTYTSLNTSGCVLTQTLNLTINYSNSSNIAVTACNAYLWPVSGQTYTQSGTYIFTSLNTSGCLQSDTLVLTMCVSINPATVFTFNNFIQTTPTQFEFDVWVTNTGNTTLNVRSFSFGMNCTPNMGTLGFSYLTGSKDPIFNVITTYSAATALKISGSNNFYHLRLTTNTATSGSEPLLAANTPYKLGRFVVSSSINWPSTFNPFLPPAGTSPIQVNTLAGYTQCVLGAFVNGSSTPYSLFGTGNIATTTNLNVLTASVDPNPTGPTPFLLNTSCSNTTSSSTVNACSSYTWSTNGITYSASGVYTNVSLIGSGPCYHTATLNLTINTNTSNSQSVTSCNTYNWALNGQTYTSSGVYTYTTLISSGPCYHTEILNLTINSGSSSNTAANACDSYLWSANGQTYTSSGTYTVTSLNTSGCLHTSTLNLIIQYSSGTSTAVNGCNSYLWAVNGQTYTIGGTYVATSLNAGGCIHRDTLVLTMCPPPNPSANFSFKNLLEVSSTQFEFDLWVTNTGNTTLHVQSLNFGLNCSPNMGVLSLGYISGSKDPIFNAIPVYTPSVSLKGTVPNTYYHLMLSTGNATGGLEPALAINTPYKVGRFLVSSSINWSSLLNPFLPPSGISTPQILGQVQYTQCVLNAFVNNSATPFALMGLANPPTATNLNVLTAGIIPNPTGTLPFLLNTNCYHTTSSITQSACNSYTWSANGQTYTSSGIFTYTTLIGSGPCTNTATLNLTINNSTSSTAFVNACNTYTWSVNGQTYTQSGTYTSTSINPAGCIHSSILNLTINSSTSSNVNVTSCNSYTWSVNGLTYTSSGMYMSTSINGAGCNQTDTLNLTICIITGPAVLFTFNNLLEVAPNQFEFDVWITNTGTATLNARSYSFGLNCSPNMGVPTFSYIAGSKDPMFNVITSYSTAVTVKGTSPNTYYHLRLTSNSATGGTEPLLVANTAFKMGRFRVTSSVNWSPALNPFLPPSGITPIQVTTVSGYTQCILGALVNNSSSTFSLYGTANLPTSTSLNVLSTNMSPSPTGTSPFLLNFCTNTTSTYNANACNSYLWSLNGQTYTNSGVYTYTSMIGSSACIHTATLYLTINNSSSSSTNATACNSYQWASNGQTYTASGIYTYTSFNAAGCIHTSTLNLTINQSTSSTTLVTACNSYTWSVNGQTYTGSGTYISTSMNNAGCVHTSSLILTINQNSSSTSSITACNSYQWSVNGLTYTSSGIYVSTSLNASGCVHTSTLNLTINLSTSTASAVTACDFYTWPINGVTYTASGTYISTSMNAAGCLHTSTLILAINLSTTSNNTVSNCNSYLWPVNGQTYTASGIYSFSFQNTAGCNHLATLNLTINQSTSSNSTVVACDAYTWSANGQTYNIPGIYIHTSLNAAGCLHTSTLNLSINFSSSSNSSVTACNTYTWSVNNQTYSNSGIYTFTSLNLFGCIHTSTLNLNINQSSSSVNTMVACNSYVWPANGQSYTASGTYTSTSLNAAGCIHLSTLNLTINQSSSSNVQITACDSYTWSANGQTYFTSGTYTTTSLNASGCLHIATLMLTMNANTTSVSSSTACNSFTWLTNGQTYTSSGTYTATSMNPAGCINTSTLNLTINYSTVSGSSITACNSYTWPANGLTYTLSGVYTSTSLNPAGCVLTSTLNLIVNYSSSSNLSAIACNQYTWISNGLTYTASGIYTTTSVNAAGCIHVSNLNLTVNQSSTSFNSETDCDFYTWPVNGQTYTSSGIYTTTSLNSFGCVHTAILNLTINQSSSSAVTIVACDTYTWPINGLTYTASGTYSTTSLNAAACVHTSILQVTINASSSSTSSATACNSYTWPANGLSYTTSGTYTATSLNAVGCLHTSTLNLTINYNSASSTSITACDSYVWPLNAQTYTASGIYTATFLNASGCVHTSTLNLAINQSSSSIVFVVQCDSYVWPVNGQTYTSSGNYSSTTMNTSGCIHASNLQLTINVSSSSTSSATACNSYTWPANGLSYTTSGTYTATSLNALGCLHTSILNLTINYSSASSTSVTACDSYVWSLNTQTYTSSGIYTATFLNASGCVHTSTLNLTINQSSSSIVFVVQCDSYVWPVNGQTYTSSGNYSYTTMNISGCIHTSNLQLTINVSSSSTNSATACNSYTWPANGLSYTTSGTYTATSLNALGCLHTSTLNLTINYSSASSTSVTACDSYVWPLNAQTYTASGIYTATFLNASGCVHTSTLIVTINHSSASTTAVTACDLYTWPANGLSYTISGTYTATSLNMAGCVYTSTLNLVINNNTSSSTAVTACDSYTWSLNGFTYTASGIYTATSLNTTGCLHTDILNLIITASTNSSDTISACNAYLWALNNQTYTASGTYSFMNGCHTTDLILTITPSLVTTDTVAACDSYLWTQNNLTYTASGIYTTVTPCQIFTLVLTIMPTTNMVTTITVCNAYLWSVNNTTYTSSGIYTEVSNCETSILDLTIFVGINTTQIETKCDEFKWDMNSLVYTASGIYFEVIGCDTAFLDLTIIPSTTIIDTATACDSFLWTYNNMTYTSTGIYTEVSGCATNVLDLTITPCASILNLTMIIQGFYDGLSSMKPVLFNQSESVDLTVTDTIEVVVFEPLTPYAMVTSQRVVLKTDGTCSCSFNGLAGSYYIGVKHRNALTTWSGNPILFSAIPANYDFTSAASMAYGDNQVEVESGVWAFYSGEVIPDENIDLLDLAPVEASIENFDFGYIETDINGDGNVDLLDSPLLEENINLFIFSNHP